MRGAMAAVRDALDALASNTDASQDAVLCLNARDSRAGLARRLDQLSPAIMRSAVRSRSPLSALVLRCQTLQVPTASGLHLLAMGCRSLR